VASPAKKFIQREIGKLVRKEGKKSSMKMGDGMEFGGLVADRLWSEYNRGTSRFYNNLLNWGKRRAEKAKLKKSKKKVRKTK
jgi:hypothetical protein